MEIIVKVVDRDTFEIRRLPVKGAPTTVARVERIGTGERFSGYWRASVPGRLLKTAKSRGGCIFAAVEHFAGI